MSLFNSFNKVVVVGNMTRDIEIRTLQSGTRVGDVAIAVNDRIKKGEEWVDETTFVDVTLWGKTAEFAERFGGKGKPVLVEGRLKQDKWVDKASGQNRTKLKVVGENIVFLDGGKGAGGGQGGGGGAGRQQSRGPGGYGSGRGQPNDEGSGAPVDDMPYSQRFEGEGESERVPF